MDGFQSFGQWLRKRRQELDLTQDKLAHIVGCASITIRKIEGDQLRPSRSLAMQLIKQVGVPIEEHKEYVGFARGEVPASRSNSRTIPGIRLPHSVSSFIGRESDIREIKNLISEFRLVTLTGVGGIGKTRLAERIAEELQNQNQYNVWFVDLASIKDPKAILRAVTDVVGIRESLDCTLIISLTSFLKGQKGLLILDNCEHLVEECAILANNLLRMVKDLVLLVTSRESLDIDGERIYRVPPLKFPLYKQMASGILAQTYQDLLSYESVKLFLDRAQAAHQEFRITPQNIAFIIQICQHLDGVPFAIELAAFRTVSMGVDQIASHLEGDYRILTGNGRKSQDRHRTLRGTIEWSYNLLSEKEKTLLCSLSLFSDGWTLSAAEIVCTNEQISKNEVMDLLSALLNKSMILIDLQNSYGFRYRMLESIRHFAAEKLLESGKKEALRRYHIEWVLQLLEANELIYYSDWHAWMKNLKAEQNNVRDALEWSIGENRNPEAGLRIMILLVKEFYYIFGDSVEGYKWIEKGKVAIEKQIALDPLFHSKILLSLAYLKCYSNPIGALALIKEAVDLFQNLVSGASMFEALILRELGWLEAFFLGELQNGLLSLNKAEIILNEQGAKARQDLGIVLWQKIWVYRQLNNKPGEKLCEDKYVSLFQELGDSLHQAYKVFGDIALRRGDYVLAARHYYQHIALWQEIGADGDISDTYRKLADVEKAQGHFEQAQFLYRFSLKQFYHQKNLYCFIWLLACLALNQIAKVRNSISVEIRQSLQSAALILGCVQTLVNRLEIPTPVPVEIISEYEQSIEYLKENLHPDMFRGALEEGRSMKVKQMLDYAIDELI